MEMKPTRNVREWMQIWAFSEDDDDDDDFAHIHLFQAHASSTKVRFYLYFTSAFTTQKLMLSFSPLCN